MQECTAVQSKAVTTGEGPFNAGNGTPELPFSVAQAIGAPGFRIPRH